MEPNEMEQRRVNRVWRLWIALCVSTVLLNLVLGWSIHNELASLHRAIGYLHRVHNSMREILKTQENFQFLNNLNNLSNKELISQQTQFLDSLQRSLHRMIQILSPDQEFREEVLNTLDVLQQRVKMLSAVDSTGNKK